MKRREQSTGPKALLSFAALAAILAIASSSGADEKAAAKEKFKEGMTAINAENYPAALTAFEESYRLVPKPALLFNIAMCEKALFRYVDSITSFQRFIRESGDGAKPELVQQAEQAMAEMMRLVGTLKISDAPEGAKVSVDGKGIGPVPSKGGVLLDPGGHSVRVEADGFKPLVTDITIASGAEVPLRAKLTKVSAWLKVDCAKGQLAVRVDGKVAGNCPYEGEAEPGLHEVTVTGPGMDDFTRSVEIKPGDSVTVSVGAAGADGEPSEGSKGLLVGGIVTAVLGVGAGVMGLAFNVKGMKDEEAAAAAPANSDERAKHNDAVETDAAMRTVGYVAGGVLVATGVVLMAVSAKKKSKGEAPVAFAPVPGGVAFSF